MIIFKARDFKKSEKKFHKNQRKDLEKAVLDIVKNIRIGKSKAGDLKGLQVHKFKTVGQLTLLAYTYEDNKITLTLLAFGSHENFYRNLKR